MNDRQKLQHLFQFDLWCNRKLTDFIMDKDPFEEKSSSTAFLSHIINAQEIWFSRVINLDIADVEIWTEHPIEDLKAKAKSSHQKWMDLIGDHEINLETLIHYENSRGTSFQNPLWQICHHLIIHGQHHRAQISLLLRKCDIAPPPIDYIYYTRLDM